MDVQLFSKIVRKFTDEGNVAIDTMVDSILKSLTDAGRLGFFIDRFKKRDIFKEKNEIKFIPDDGVKRIILRILCVITQKPSVETGNYLDDGVWDSFEYRDSTYCRNQDFEKACHLWQRLR